MLHLLEGFRLLLKALLLGAAHPGQHRVFCLHQNNSFTECEPAKVVFCAAFTLLHCPALRLLPPVLAVRLVLTPRLLLMPGPALRRSTATSWQPCLSV